MVVSLIRPIRRNVSIEVWRRLKSCGLSRHNMQRCPILYFENDKYIHSYRYFGSSSIREAKKEFPEHPPPPPPGYIVGPTPEVEQLVEDVLQLKMIEFIEFMEIYKRRTGLTDDEYVREFSGSSDSGRSSDAKTSAVEEKTVFDVKLTSYDAKSKIKVIKEVRAITGLGLKEAKEMVEGVPKILKKDLTKDEAEKLVALFKAIGGECSMD